MLTVCFTLVTFSAINDKSSDTTTTAKPSGYTINDDDDLDYLFDTHGKSLSSYHGSLFYSGL